MLFCPFLPIVRTKSTKFWRFAPTLNILLHLTFFSSQNRKEIRKFRLAGAGKNKGFWPKYLPLRVERGAVLTHRGLHRRLYITERGCTIQVIPSRKEKIVKNHTSTRKQNQQIHRSTSKQIVFFTCLHFAHSYVFKND